MPIGKPEPSGECEGGAEKEPSQRNRRQRDRGRTRLGPMDEAEQETAHDDRAPGAENLTAQSIHQSAKQDFFVYADRDPEYERGTDAAVDRGPSLRLIDPGDP
jgi:hypothetical protein